MIYQLSLLFILCSICTAYAVADCKSQRTLTLLTMLPPQLREGNRTPNRVGWSYLGHTFLESAIESINNSSDLLPCNNLSLIVKDDGCSSRETETAKTATSLISGLFPEDESKVVGILGPACSESARKVVYIANKPEIELVVLHSGGSSIFEHSKNSLDILGSTRPLFDLSLALIEESSWENICILYESSHHYYRNMKDDFIEEVAQNGVNIAVTLQVDVSSASDSFYPLDEIRSSRVRIVFLFTSLEHSKRILCLAYHMGLVYPSYQWVIVSHSLSDIVPEIFDDFVLTFSYNKNSCSHENLKRAVEKSFLINSQRSNNTETYNNTNLGKSTSTSISDDSMQEMIMSVKSIYDALWAWATVLHNLTLDSREVVFDYGNASLAGLILDRFHHLQFKGLSGPIASNTTSGFVDHDATLYQISDSREIIIATTKNSKVVENWQPFSHISDRMQNVELVHAGLIVFFMVVQSIELVAIIVLHVMTVMFRNKKTVKVTSVKLVNFVFIGGYLFIATLMVNCISWLNVYGSGIDAVLCHVVWAWGLPLSFTLTFGIAIVRTWRLYRIFVHYLSPGKLISNPALTAAVLILISIDIVIAVIWTSIDPMRFRYLEITVQTGSEYDVFLEPECYHNIAWPILIFLYKIALLLALIVLTVLTRRIPSSTFATKSNQMFTYTFSTVFLLGFALYYIFVSIHRDPYAEFITLFTLLNTMIVLFAVFIIIPPLLPVFHNWKT